MRLKFIRRARHLGLSLEEIRRLLGRARSGHCPERQYLVQLRRQMDQCDAKVAELQAFRVILEERYRLAVECKDEVREIQRG